MYVRFRDVESGECLTSWSNVSSTINMSIGHLVGLSHKKQYAFYKVVSVVWLDRSSTDVFVSEATEATNLNETVEQYCKEHQNRINEKHKKK